ncbi:uncharacterized protein LOC142324854 [Lycorma delicatula]|uniref:uncharacterized protein LOC142324854 n=1 Tax=Lycorma delicatula TaxID=130591 RepID=UPI003F5177A4
MPQHKNPTSLEDLCYQAVKCHLLTLCQILHDRKMSPRQLRTAWISSLPGTVRTRLLQETTDIKDGPIPFYLMGLLLAPDVDRLRIELCCYYGCSHQAAMLRLLAVEGKGLRSLELARSALLRLDQSLLQSVLLNANSLQHLTMRNIATDATLAVIGSSCQQLITLDISNSRQVTDIGIKQLFIKIELRDKSHLSDPNNYAVSISTKPQSSRWRSLYKMFRSIQQLMGSCNGHTPNDDIESYGSILLECYESPNTITSTLRVLNITNTGVTSAGVFLALQNSKCIQSVGEYPQMGRVLQLVSSKFEMPPKFQLKNVRTTITTAHTIDVINKLCPFIEQLIAMDTKFLLPSELSTNDIPSTLKSLILLEVPPLPLWLTEFYWFLGEIRSVLISELVLKFFATEVLVRLELDKLLNLCPMLKTLVIDGADINWSLPLTNSKQTLLQKVQLGQIVTGQVLLNLITQSPQLITAHFYKCTDITEEEMISLKSSMLKCFYIYETRLINASSIIIELLYNCPQLQHVGNITNWGASVGSTCDILQSVKDKNYDLQFNAGSHWYYSPCINKYE